MTAAAIPVAVFARADSRRLPNKCFRTIGGRPMLARALDRVAATGRPVVLATSTRPVDDPIADFAAEAGIDCVRGSAEDVLGRAAAVLAHTGAPALVRISGDSPFIDPALIEAVVALFEAERPDLATNVFPRSFPPGQSVEVIAADALRQADAEAADPADREHVTTWFYRQPERFRIANHAVDPAFDSRLKFAVDTADDLAFADRLAASVPDDAGLAALAAAAADLQSLTDA